MRFLLTVGAALLASSLAAETFDCTMTSKGIGGFIGNRMLLSVDPETGEGAALDGAIFSVHGKAVPVETTRTSSVRWRFKYTVEGVPVSNEGTGIVSYTVHLNTQRMRVNVSGRLHGFDNQISGSGRCERVG